jgi:hypothetical protein
MARAGEAAIYRVQSGWDERSVLGREPRDLLAQEQLLDASVEPAVAFIPRTAKQLRRQRDAGIRVLVDENAKRFAPGVQGVNRAR